jgi:teichuronic acid biosynthesis glycosyltransferase TuaC
MRILFVAPGAQIGAHMVFVRREADMLRAGGHEVELFGFDNASYVNFLSELRRLRAAVRRFKPALVHAQFGKFNALLAAFAGAPLVITFRGTDINRNSKYSLPRAALGVAASQLAAFFARGIVCVSRDIRAKVWACRWRPALVLPTGVDLGVFVPMDKLEARRRLGYGAHERVVLFNAGKNPAVKAPELAAAAVREAERLVGTLRFVVLDGAARPQDVPLYMNAADVLLVTSKTEGSPAVVQEAMACNLPVISVDVGDVRERLEGVAECVVVERAPAALGAALARALRRQKRSDGREHAAALGLGAIAAQLAEFYRAVLAGRARGSAKAADLALLDSASAKRRSQRPSSIFKNTPSSTKKGTRSSAA